MTKVAVLAAALLLGPAIAGARERAPGLYGGLSLGGGRLELDCDTCDHWSFQLSGELGWSFAIDVMRHRLVGVHVIIDALSTYRTGNSHALGYLIGAGARIWAKGPIWFDASAGYGGVSLGPQFVDSPDAEGFAILARAGVEVLRREKLSVDVRGGVTGIFVDPGVVGFYVAVGITFFGIAGDYSGPRPSPYAVPPPPVLSN
jgi:hypothetical protein